MWMVRTHRGILWAGSMFTLHVNMLSTCGCLLYLVCVSICGCVLHKASMLGMLKYQCAHTIKPSVKDGATDGTCYISRIPRFLQAVLGPDF